MISCATVLSFLLALAASASPLLNAGFEAGRDGVPAAWSLFGEGRVEWITGASRGNKVSGTSPLCGDVHGGRRCVKLDGGQTYQMLYQFTDGALPGAVYTASVWVRAPEGSGDGRVKIEFMDAAGEKRQTEFPFTAGKEWKRVEFVENAPGNAVRAGLTLIAGGGATIFFDDASLEGKKVKPDKDIAFDLSRLGQRIDGYGVHHWASSKRAAEEFAELNITNIRITQDWDSWEDMKELRAKTDARGIKWLYVKWVPPGQFMKDGALADVPGYATDWVDTVRELDRNGCRPHYIDLVNEPDYFGIPPAPYNELVKLVRRRLDESGFTDVQIAGPGLTHIGTDNFRKYIDALDDGAVKALGVWATHAWEDAWDDQSGSVAITEARTMDFVPQSRARDASKPVWYTEYATRQNRFHGVLYPDSDRESRDYCTSFTVPYAARVYENTLAILNGGANVPFYWSSEDYPGKEKQWGYIGPKGERKPVWYALKGTYGAIRPGSRVVVPPPAMARKTLYAAAFVDEGGPQKGVVVCAVNTGDGKREAVIRLKNAPAGLKVVKAERFEAVKLGDPAKREGDTARLAPVKVRLSGSKGNYELKVSLARDSALTVVLAGN
jgi:hypothetical protein